MPSITSITHWFNAIRNLPDHTQRTRAMDAMWSGQLQSKEWLIDSLSQFLFTSSKQNAYVFGGWIGVLGSMLIDSGYVNKVRSIDLDPWCEKVADDLNKQHEMNNWRFKAVTADMSTYQYQSDIRADIVVNTSCEHITQEQYDQWLNNVPDGALIVAQGNNFFSCSEHVRCSIDLADFRKQCRIDTMDTEVLLESELVLPEYTRFMIIWRK